MKYMELLTLKMVGTPNLFPTLTTADRFVDVNRKETETRVVASGGR